MKKKPISQADESQTEWEFSSQSWEAEDFGAEEENEGDGIEDEKTEESYDDKDEETAVYFAFELSPDFNLLYIEASEDDANVLAYLYSLAEQFDPKLQVRIFDGDFNHRHLQELSPEELELLSQNDFFGKVKPKRKIDFEDDDTLEASITYDDGDYIQNLGLPLEFQK